MSDQANEINDVAPSSLTILSGRSPCVDQVRVAT